MFVAEPKNHQLTEVIYPNEIFALTVAMVVIPPVKTKDILAVITYRVECCSNYNGEYSSGLMDYCAHCF